MTAQSPCRSPNRRIHTTSRSTPKTRGVWHHTNHYPSKSSLKQPTLPIHYPSTMRRINNKRYLPTTNRLKISNCLLLRKPYGPSSCCNHNPNPMSLFRSNNPNNLARFNLLNTILPSQHKLRTNPQPNPPTHTRTTTATTANRNLMTISQLNKHGTTTNN